MEYFYNDDHDEDDLPVISLPNISPFTTRISNDNHNQDEIETDYSSRLIGNWQNLYETSIQLLQTNDDDEDQRPTTPKPFHLSPQPTVETPQREISPSPIPEPELDLNPNKSKWSIRLPELLNGTVGPDRQKRDVTRRHTTSITSERFNAQNTELTPHSSNGPKDDRPISPIVKQLTQKFNRMTANITPPMSHRYPQQFSSNGSLQISRATSLTSLVSIASTSERIVHKPRPVLPVRPSPEITTGRQRTASTGILNNRPPLANGRSHQREKTSPPVSYPRHFYPPPSTTSVVKQLIGGGATLVYDSITQPNARKTNSSITKHQRTIEDRTRILNNSKSILTGRHLPSDASSDTYVSIKNNNYPSIKSEADDSDGNYYEPLTPQIPNASSIRKYLPAPTEHSNARRNTTENYYPVYD